MPTALHHHHLLLLLLLLASLHFTAPMSPTPAPMADANATAHDVLAQFGFPAGLLPGNVASYTVSDDGAFTVELSTEPCYIWFSDLAYYGRTIRGKITDKVISSISGIQVRKYFIWLSITHVVASDDGSSVLFGVGFLSEKHPASEFQVVHACEKWGGPASACLSRRGGVPGAGVAPA